MDDPLEQLYPHLAPGDAADDLTGALSESIVAVKQAFLQAGAATLLAMSAELARAFRDGGRLLTMGNGGSSCDAAHVAVEFNHPVTTGRPALSAIHLGADIAMLTAVGNDVGFRDVFVRQVVAHGRAGDVLLGLSTSGNSENLLAAFARARRG